MTTWAASPLIDPRTIVGHPDYDPTVARASLDAFIKSAFRSAGPQPSTVVMSRETAEAFGVVVAAITTHGV